MGFCRGPRGRCEALETLQEQPFEESTCDQPWNRKKVVLELPALARLPFPSADKNVVEEYGPGRQIAKGAEGDERRAQHNEIRADAKYNVVSNGGSLLVHHHFSETLPNMIILEQPRCVLLNVKGPPVGPIPTLGCFPKLHWIATLHSSQTNYQKRRTPNEVHADGVEFRKNFA